MGNNGKTNETTPLLSVGEDNETKTKSNDTKYTSRNDGVVVESASSSSSSSSSSRAAAANNNNCYCNGDDSSSAADDDDDRVRVHNENDTLRDRVKEYLIKFYDRNHFLLKAILAIFIAKLYPPLGAEILRPQITGQWICVMFIFCLAGILIKTSELGTAVTQWKFNFFVLIYNFLGVSAMVYGVTKLLLLYLPPKYGALTDEGMIDGMIVCSCMPMSVSITIVFTRMANGEVANATLIAPSSSLISVFLSPLLILLYMGTKTHIDLVRVILKLLARVLLPMLIGQLLQRVKSVMDFVDRNLTKLKRLQEYALVYIVYTVFCGTFLHPIDAGLIQIVSMAVCQNILLGIATIIAWVLLGVFFKDEPKLRVMGLFGCTQKSAAVGIPLIGAIFEDDPKLAGLYTLPLLIWHPSQIVLGGILIPKLVEFVKKEQQRQQHQQDDDKDDEGNEKKKKIVSSSSTTKNKEVVGKSSLDTDSVSNNTSDYEDDEESLLLFHDDE